MVLIEDASIADGGRASALRRLRFGAAGSRTVVARRSSRAGSLRDRSHALMHVANTVGGFGPRDLDPRADVARDFEVAHAALCPRLDCQCSGPPNVRALDVTVNSRPLAPPQWSQHKTMATSET